MINDRQRMEILRKLSIILNATKTCKNIGEIEKITGIPSSTIQRYLNREDYFLDLANADLLKYDNVETAINYTKKWLESSKKEGIRRGGITSQEKYGYQKNENGKFEGHSR